MAMQLNLFGRQTLIEGTFYSDIFDVTAYSNVQFELRIFHQNGTGSVEAQLEQTTDPRLNAWSDAGSAVSVSGDGKAGTGKASGLLKFLRAEVTIPASTTGAVIEVIGVAREDS